MRSKGWALILISVLSTQALAEDRAMTARSSAPVKEQECAMQETALVGVNFNNMNVDLSQIKTVFDKKIEDIRLLGKEAGIEDLRIQSYNYNVYDNNSSGGCGNNVSASYQYSGNISFDVKPLEKAADFAALLSKNGFSANLNVNAYNQCQ